jgi:hypothetical protein
VKVHAPEDVPLWVPAPVRSDVIAWVKNPQYREHPTDLATLLRLATDRRMRTVWTELEGKHPAALRQFFFAAYDATVHPRRVVTTKQLEADAARVSRSADDVRWIDQSTAKKLDEAARAMRARSKEPGADPPVVLSPSGWRPPLVVVQRHEQNDETRAYVLELASVTRKLFGSTMRRTIATTASVALQTTVTERQVRNWTPSAS